MNDLRDPELPALQKAALVIRELRRRLARAERERDEPIAVIGMACRFPGGANDPERFWRLLDAGGDAITEIPAGRERSAPWRDPDSLTEDGGIPRFGAFIDAVDCFDARFFGITGREAAMMDPQHRLLLETSWHALEDAGIDPLSLRGSATGVYVGIASNDYAQLLLMRQDYSAYYLTGNPFSAACGRIAFNYGLHGPCVALDTACSASLVAVHEACQALWREDCSLALAAGVNLVLLPHGSIILNRAGMLAPDGRCKTLDASANGYVRGEGCGLVVLKRLPDAIRDGDPIRAVLRGSAVNHGGQSSGFTVPNGTAQRVVIERALAQAKTAPAEIGFVELHGTGTQLGDPIEVRALATALSPGRPAGESVIIGSVKSNIGHLEGAAGIAGLIKTILAIEHDRIPASLHIRTLNPEIPWAELPVSPAQQARDWRNGPRVAGVSSFGASGTNAHVIVAAAPPAAIGRAARPRRSTELLLLSAASPTGLTELAARHAAALAELPAADFADYAATAATGRAHLVFRLALVASDPQEASARLGAVVHGNGREMQGQAARRPRLALMLGAQPPRRPPWGMPGFEASLAECGEREGPEAEALATLYALGRAWLALGVQPAMLVGSGVGLRAGAVLAGALDLADALAAPAEATLPLGPARLPLYDAHGTAVERMLVPADPIIPEPGLLATIGGTVGLCLGSGAPDGLIAMAEDCDAWPALAGQLAALFVAGAPVDWATIYPPQEGRRLRLPSYPFARERHWLPSADRLAAVPKATIAPVDTNLASIFERQLGETATALSRVVDQQLAALTAVPASSDSAKRAAALAIQQDTAMPDLVLAAADDAAALSATLGTLADGLRRLSADQWRAFAGQSRREARGLHRAMIVANGPQDAAQVIAGGAGRRLRLGEAGDIRIAYVFPGLGEQHPGMAKELYERNLVFRAEFDRLSDLASASVEADLREIIFSSSPPKRDLRSMLRRGPQPAPDRLAHTLYAHAAIFVVELALVGLWRRLGVEPVALAGYSLGEYTAACVAEVIDEGAALKLIAARARLIETTPAGGMVAAAAPRGTLEPLLGNEMWIAVDAAPELTVVGGAEAALDELCARLGEASVAYRRLSARHAFHTPQVVGIARPYREAVAGIAMRPPRIPYLANLTGDWVTAAQATDPDWWVRHTLEPVRFVDALKRLLTDRGIALIEVGPGQSLTSFVHQLPRSEFGERLAVPSLRAANDAQSDEAAFLAAAGRLWLAGAPVDWARW